MQRIPLISLTFGLIGCLQPFLAPCRAADTIEYNRDIRPILAENCFACHGPDSAARKGDLRLDQLDAAVASAAIVLGKPDESGIIERILSADTELVMPPPSSHKTLSPAQIETLKQPIGLTSRLSRKNRLK